MVGNVCLKSVLKAAGSRGAGAALPPPPATVTVPRWPCAAVKDRTKPFTPEFNFDLAVAGLKSHGDGQLDCKELIPSPLPSPPSVFYSFSFQLAWFAAEKLGKQTANRPRPCGCCCLEDDAGSPAPGMDAQLGLYLLPLTSVAPHVAVGVCFLGLEHLSRGCLSVEMKSIAGAGCASCGCLHWQSLALNPDFPHVLGHLGVF